MATAAGTRHLMHCMEVWGGNRAADLGVVMPGLDAWVFSEPHAGDGASEPGDHAGGDVHFVSSCGTGRIARMVLADVSGHGQSVASASNSLRTLMRRYMNYLDQTAFVEALNRAFGDPAMASGRFATSIAMTFFAPTARLDLCNAGHPRPLAYRASSRRWAFLAAPERAEATDEVANLPLGVLEPTRYEEFSVALAPGDLVLAYTDAAIEARSPSGELFGEDRLLGLVESLDAMRPEALLADLRGALASWRAGAAPDDDLTLLLIRHNGVGTQAPLLRRLGASVRFLGAVARNLVPVGERPPIPWPELRRENVLGALVPRTSRSWRATEGT